MVRRNSTPLLTNRSQKKSSSGDQTNSHVIKKDNIPKSRSFIVYKTALISFIAVVGIAIILNDIGYLSLNNFTFWELLTRLSSYLSLVHVRSLFIEKETEKSDIKIFNKWREAEKEDFKRYGTTLCNVDRVNVDEISSKRFEKEYRLKKPLLITFRNGAYDWTDPEKWTLGSLKKEYGDWMLFSGNSLELVRQGGNGYIGSTFEEYVDSVMSKDSKDEKLYVFDRNFYQDSALPQTLNVPPFLVKDPSTDSSLFFLGSSGTGVSFHNHADSWNAVVFGHKHWFLYNIDQNPPGGVYPGFTQLDWYHRVYPNLTEKEKPIECVQKPGEILYLPEGMYHGTINIGDTVALGVQKNQAATQVMRNMYEENELREQGEVTVLERMDLIQKVLEIYPDSAEMNQRLGALYDITHQLLEAEEHCERAVQLDPYFIMAYITLSEVKTKLEKYDEAEVLLHKVLALNPRLWDVYAKYGMFLKDRQRHEEAAEVFRQGIDLDPTQTPFYYYLHEVELALGNIEAAQQAQDKLLELQALMEQEDET